jgi:hypothetical protein
MKDRLLTTKQWTKLKDLGLCRFDRDHILFTKKAEQKYPVLKGRLYNFNWLGHPEGQKFEVPNFTPEKPCVVIRQDDPVNPINSKIKVVLVEYCFLNFWEELQSEINFEEIEL